MVDKNQSLHVNLQRAVEKNQSASIFSTVQWQLNINLSKCRVLHLGNAAKSHPVSYFINGVKLVDDCSVGDLGVLTDRALRYSDHISAVCSKARSHIVLLFRGFVSRDRTIMVKIYVRRLVVMANRSYK